MASGKFAVPVTPYDRRVAEAFFALHGYQPIQIFDVNRHRSRVGLKCMNGDRAHVCTAEVNDTLCWYTGLTNAWRECSWDKINAAILHNMFYAWRRRYEP